MFTEVSPCGLLPVAKHDLGMFDSWRLLKLRDTPLNLWQTKILKNYENEGRGLSSTHPIIITLRLSWSWSFLVFLADNLVQELEVTMNTESLSIFTDPSTVLSFFNSKLVI